MGIANDLTLNATAIAPSPVRDLGLRCEVVTDFARLERLAPEWKKLFAGATPAGGIFQSWGWARAYWSVFHRELSLCTPVVYSGDRVVAILPLAIRGRSAHLLGEPYADYGGILCEPKYVEEAYPILLNALLRAPLPWTECVLASVPETSPLLRPGMLPTPLLSRQQIVFQNVSLAASNDGGHAFEALSRKESLRRHENRLARRGHLSFRHVEDRQEIFAFHLQNFFRMRIARHASEGIESQFLQPSPRAMVEALVTELDPAHELRFSALELDGRPIAYHLGMQHAGTFTWYMPTFDIDLRDDGPGEVLLRNLLQYAHAQQLHEFDFTIGDESYKTRFCNSTRQLFTMYFYHFPRNPLVELRRMGRSARDEARRSPRLVSQVRYLRGRKRELCVHLRNLSFAALLQRVKDALASRRPPVYLRAESVPKTAGADIRRVTFSELVVLVPGTSATHKLHQQRLKRGDELYMVSTKTARNLYWITRESCETHRSSVVTISNAAAPPAPHAGDSPELLCALICALGPGTFSIPRSANAAKVKFALRRCGAALIEC